MDSIHIGYISSFVFKDEAAGKQLSGHPKEGRVYQLLLLDGNYHVHIGHERTDAKLDGISLGSSLTGNYNDRWHFDIKVVDKTNLFDFQLCEQDLDKVSHWLDTDHAELRKLVDLPMRKIAIVDQNEEGDFEGVSPEDTKKIEEALERAMEKHFPITKDVVKKISGGLNFILFRSPELLEVFSELIFHISSHIAAQVEGTFRDQMGEEFLLNSKSKDTAIYNAIQALNTYTKDSSDSVEALYNSIYYSLLELQRRKLQDGSTEN